MLYENAELLLFRGQVEGYGFVLEMAFVRTITEGLVIRQTATADADQRSPPQVVRGTRLINNLKVAFYL